jgi:hypothetical protein
LKEVALSKDPFFWEQVSCEIIFKFNQQDNGKL